MAFDFSKLRGRIVEKYGSCAAFAEAAGCSPGQISRRLNNQTPFDDQEIHAFSKLLEIPESDLATYFFTHKV